MEIKIKKIGKNSWTVGALAKGLENGEIKLSEGMTAEGVHGLWLTSSKGENYLLAIYEICQDRTWKYLIVKNTRHGNMQGKWTNAAWRTLMEIAQMWCNERNEELQNETPLKIKLVRVEIESKN